MGIISSGVKALTKSGARKAPKAAAKKAAPKAAAKKAAPKAAKKTVPKKPSTLQKTLNTKVSFTKGDLLTGAAFLGGGSMYAEKLKEAQLKEKIKKEVEAQVKAAYSSGRR